MSGKITDYPTMTTLASGDLLDVSDYDGVSAFVSKSIDWDILKTNIEGQITFTNLYTANGTLAGFREVEMGINDMVFKTTGDANLLRFDSTSDRIGIGLAAPAEKLDVLGNVKIATSGANDPLKVYSFNNVTLGLQQDNNANVIHNQYSHFKNTLTLGNTLSGVANLLLLDSDWKYEHGSITIENQGVGFNEPTIKIANSPNTLNFYNTLGAGNTYNAGTGNGGYWSTGNFGIGTDPTEKLEVAGGVNVNANVTNQLYVSNSASFVGVRTATALGNESFRVVGEMNAGGVGVGNVINPASNRFTANTGGSLKFGSQVIKDDSNSWYFESSTNTFKFRNNLNAYSLLQLTPSNALFESKDSSVGTTLEDETIGISSSYYNGSVNLSVANIKNTAIDVLGAYKLGFEVGGSERLAINNDGTIEVDGNNAVASFSGAVTNITIVNGIVTAVS